MNDQDQDEAPRQLRDQIEEVISAFDDDKLRASGVMALLNETGHYLPGLPSADVILNDARRFAEELTLSNLALRLIRMTIMTGILTPESKGSERWLRDYLDGRNHGPVGKPMLWPAKLPGLAGLMRDWGYKPTPTKPAFVTRDLDKPEGPQPDAPTIN